MEKGRRWRKGGGEGRWRKGGGGREEVEEGRR